MAYEQLDAVGNSGSLLRVKPEAVLCNTVVVNRCAAENGTDLFYYDDNHLSNKGAAMLASEIVNAMREKGWL